MKILYVASLCLLASSAWSADKPHKKADIAVPVPEGKSLQEMIYNFPAPPPEQGSAEHLPKRPKRQSKPAATQPAIATIGDWTTATGEFAGTAAQNGHLVPTEDTGSYTSAIHPLETPTQLSSITLTQSTEWMEWNPVENVGPKAGNAPVLLPVADDDYYFFAQGKGGYHAFHSTDMKTWKDLGSLGGITWVTTAEYSNGHFYIYYDAPNDQDPHLIIDDDLTDDKLPIKMGVAFRDPSAGSDCAVFIDDADDDFHIIYEDWSPINAQRNAWDSPLAGHTSSSDGLTGFEPHEHPFPVDHRTTPTGQLGIYHHISSKAEPLEAPKEGKKKRRRGALYYEIHEPLQEAYGDWTAIKVGSEYYLFCDHDKVSGEMGVARFHSSDLMKEEFQHQQTIGKGHPDPTVGFAEGQFYLVTQMSTDYTSPGPWVDGVTTRVGIDSTGDGKIDSHTEWQTISESYQLKPGYSRVVEITPASLDLSELPKAHAWQVEIKIDDTAVEMASPKIRSVELR